MAAPSSKGVLITLEGIDGTGKSTLVADLGRLLERAHVKSAVQREPTPSWLGESVRRAHTQRVLPLAHTFLFLADRAEHTVFMADQLKWGSVIVCDRYFDSTVAYQGAQLAGVLEGSVLDPVDFVRDLHKPWVLIPDLTLLIVDEPARCMERVMKARGQKSMFEDVAFLTKVQENYKRLAAAEPARFHVIQGGDLADLRSKGTAAVEAFLLKKGLLKRPFAEAV